MIFDSSNNTDSEHATDSERPKLSRRSEGVLSKIEVLYLQLLRAAILIIATVLLGYAAWMGIAGFYKISQSPDSVQIDVARVYADEITNAEMPDVAEKILEADDGKRINPENHQYYDDFVKRYYKLFTTQFEPFRQPEDKNLTQEEFDDSFLDTTSRLDSIANGTLNFEADKQDLEGLLEVMTDAAGKPTTQNRLKQYKSAKKVPVARKVQRTRTIQRQGWNSLGSDCAYWYDPPVGCPETRTVQQPYTETVTTMELPQGTQSHAQIFRAFQDRYFALLNEKRNASAKKAEGERMDIMNTISEGHLSLSLSLYMIGGFLALMFFFLLIAIERHQRKIASSDELVCTKIDI